MFFDTECFLQLIPTIMQTQLKFNKCNRIASIFCLAVFIIIAFTIYYYIAFIIFICNANLHFVIIFSLPAN